MEASQFKKNLHWLRNINEQLYKLMKNMKTPNSYLTHNECGRVVLVKDVGGQSFPLYSLYDETPQCQAWIEQFEYISTELYIIYGLGLGYELNEILKKDLKTPILFIEPDYEVFYYFLHYFDISLLSKYNIQFIVGNSIEDYVFSFREFVGARYIKKFHIIPQSGYYYLYKDIILQVELRLKELLNEVLVDISTTLAANTMWMHNKMINLQQYMPSSAPVEVLANAFCNIPAIMVSAGPSLEDDITYIKQLYDNALIVTVGSGLSVLESHKVKAHMAAALDGNDSELGIFENIHVNDDIFLLYTSTLFPEVPDLFRKEKFFFALSPFDEFYYKQINHKSMARVQGFSIAISTLDILAKLGCNPIVLTGQDFCYSRQKNYAEGASYFDDDLKSRQEFSNLTVMKNRKGALVYTKPSFLAMKTAMEQVISQHSQITFVNCTQDGLTIRGTGESTLGDLVQDVFSRPYNIPKIIMKHYDQYKTLFWQTKTTSIVALIREELSAIMGILINIIEEIDILFAENILASVETYKKVSIYEEALDKYSFFNEVLIKECAIFYYLFQQVSFSGLEELPTDVQTTVLELEKKRKFFAAIYDLCLTIQGALEQETFDGGDLWWMLR